jgi:hypothetical protein
MREVEYVFVERATLKRVSAVETHASAGTQVMSRCPYGPKKGIEAPACLRSAGSE